MPQSQQQHHTSSATSHDPWTDPRQSFTRWSWLCTFLGNTLTHPEQHKTWTSFPTKRDLRNLRSCSGCNLHNHLHRCKTMKHAFANAVKYAHYVLVFFFSNIHGSSKVTSIMSILSLIEPLRLQCSPLFNNDMACWLCSTLPTTRTLTWQSHLLTAHARKLAKLNFLNRLADRLDVRWCPSCGSPWWEVLVSTDCNRQPHSVTPSWKHLVVLVYHCIRRVVIRETFIFAWILHAGNALPHSRDAPQSEPCGAEHSAYS